MLFAFFHELKKKMLCLLSWTSRVFVVFGPWHCLSWLPSPYNADRRFIRWLNICQPFAVAAVSCITAAKRWMWRHAATKKNVPCPYVGVLSRDESCHGRPLKLIVAACHLWAVAVDADKMKQKKRRLQMQSPVLPLPHPQKSLKDQLWDQWYDLWGRMLKVNFKGTMMDFFYYYYYYYAGKSDWKYVVDRTIMFVNLLFLPPVKNSSWLQIPTLEH